MAVADNPLFAGEHADFLALIPFAAIVGILLLVAREKMRVNRKS